MNIVLVNHYAGSFWHGMEYRPFFLAKEWISLGHNVVIVAASYSHVRQVQPVSKKCFSEESIDEIRYVWIRTQPYDGNGIRRGFNILEFVAKLGVHGAKIAAKYRPDVIIASSTYPLDIIPCDYIARRSRGRLIFEVHDLWPLTPIELGGLSRFHPFVLLMQWSENYAYRRAQVVISMLPKAEGHMVQHGLAPGKFRYIPNGINMEEWKSYDKTCLPEEIERAIIRSKQQGSFVIGYAGAHGTANALESLVQAAHLLEGEKVAIFLVGQGPEKKRLIDIANGLNVKNLHFFDSIPKKAVPSFLKAMDALYIGLLRTPIFRFGVSPNKLMDYMMAEKPIIQAIEAGNDMVAEVSCGLSIPPEDARAISDAVRRLMLMSASQRGEMGRRGRDYVEKHHDYRVLAKEFVDCVNL